jgi:DNA polymerase (family 10)
VEGYALRLDAQFKQQFPGGQWALTGDFRRQLEIVSKLQWVTTAQPDAVQTFRSSLELEEGVVIDILYTKPEDFVRVLFETSCSGEFLELVKARPGWKEENYIDEQKLFQAVGLPYIQPFRREQNTMGAVEVVQPGDVRAVIHSHSNWSDGSNTLEEMAAACIKKGYEYLVISDHSKSAFYANGLKEDRIDEQHRQIEELNSRLAPFHIFKSIECDILNDGSLDYTDDILGTFDLVIASIHSNLKMSEEKAMNRLLKAIENPYTTIIGHLTGRLLLSRPGYPVDHKRIIDACVANDVVIELNAHPRRLDMDWRWIGYALERGALISIDPDAHTIEGYNDIRYGVLTAQKAGVRAENNLSSFGIEKFRQFLGEQRRTKGV